MGDASSTVGKIRRRERAANPAVSAVLTRIGSNLRTARVARDISLADAAARAGISVQTLRALEKGAPGVSMESMAAMLWQMNMLEGLAQIADPIRDEEGQRLAALRAPTRARGARVQSPAQKSNWTDVGLDNL